MTDSKDSAKIPQRFRCQIQNIPQIFRKDSDASFEKTRKDSAKIPMLALKDSAKIPQKIPQRFRKTSPKCSTSEKLELDIFAIEHEIAIRHNLLSRRELSQKYIDLWGPSSQIEHWICLNEIYSPTSLLIAILLVLEQQVSLFCSNPHAIMFVHNVSGEGERFWNRSSLLIISFCLSLYCYSVWKGTLAGSKTKSTDNPHTTTEIPVRVRGVRLFGQFLRK